MAYGMTEGQDSSVQVQGFSLLAYDAVRAVWEFFKLQKRIIRIMTGHSSRDSRRQLFIDLKILPQPSLYIYHLILFVNKNNDSFTANNKIRNYCTRQCCKLRQPAVNLAQFQKGVLCKGVKIYNSLPTYITKTNLKQFWKVSYIKTPFILSKNSSTITHRSRYKFIIIQVVHYD